ncbi:MAG: glycosyltransferase family 2 protein [Candidatus Omnitrophica bacterium]|nr:glycosyltransferase family 2 protein [Candidatus Omnitrophota bacterium]
MNKTCVLIPSYNEARTIGGIVKDVIGLGLAAYVIDDGSSDDTAAIARKAGAVVVRHETNKGKGASLREGFKHVLNGKFEAAIIIDGDAQHEVISIPDFIKKAQDGNADLVIGNRMLDTKGMPFIRRATNRFMSWIVSRICGQEIPDTQCGYRLIKRKVLETVELKSSNFEIESELIIKACRKGFRVGSVPIKTIYKDEKSKINPIVDTLRFMVFMVKLWRDK